MKVFSKKAFLYLVLTGLFAAALIYSILISETRPLEPESSILRMANKQADAKSLHPHRATASHDRVVAEQIFNGLLRYRLGTISTSTLEPDLAQAMPESGILPDGRQQWIFNLRRGVKFHPYDDNPGCELTAEDVVFSFRRAADPKHSAYSGDYAGMSFEVAGRYNVAITLDQPVSSSLFLPKVVNRGGGLIICRKAVEEKGEDWFNNHPAGTGPFIFESYTPMEKVVLSANQHYFRSTPHLAGIEFYYMPNVISRELALRKGEVDMIWGPREQIWAEKIGRLPGIAVDITGSAEIMTLHFNMSIEPLNLLQVRQAIAYGIDRREFIALYGEKVTEPVYAPVPMGRMNGGLTRDEVGRKGLLYDLDLERAKKLLIQAGYPQGFSLEVFASESDTYVKAYDLLQAQLARVGIELEISLVDQAAYHSRIRQNLNPLVFYACYRPNADIILTQFYHSSSIVVSGANPITNFSHLGAVDADGDGTLDSIDRIIESARQEPDRQRQTELWKEAQVRILQLMASYPVMGLGYTFARRSILDWGYDLVAITDGPKATEQTRLRKGYQPEDQP